MIKQLKEHLKIKYSQEKSGHDFSHIERVITNAKKINQVEKEDETLVILMALLHDEYDEKFYEGNLRDDLTTLLNRFNIELESSSFETLVNDLSNIGFKGGFEKKPLSKIGQIVEDADRLDAIGAIGIARAFTYGGHKGRPMIGSEQEYTPLQNKKEYRESNRPTLFHFYDKLLKIKDLMHTETGKKLAQRRHDFMLQYLEELKNELDD